LVTDWGSLLIATATALLGALGLAYWAFRAQVDRSARVGLYLLFGIPAALLLLAGIATFAQGDATLASLLILAALGLGSPLLRPFRLVLARVTPIDPDSAIDMTGLCLALGLLGVFPALSFAQFQGEPPEPSALAPVEIADVVIQNVALAAIATIAVGMPYWRNVRQVVDRLDIVVPNPRTAGIAIAAVAGCFAVIGISGAVAQQFDPGLGESLEGVVDQITAGLPGPLGVLALGLSAGIGEEALFRGALQPRYGIVIPSLLFTVLHGPQYGLDVMLVGLFGVSVIFGLERKYLNTTAAIITHALYDIVAASVALMS
jgi:membrane protease YdiL (CAAX protease family)